MIAQKNYNKMFLGGLLKRGKKFAEENPGVASKASGLFGGRFGLGVGGPMSGVGLMSMLGQKLRDRRNANASAAADTSIANATPGMEMPMANYGAMVKKYRAGGMIYAENGDEVENGDKVKSTSGGASNLFFSVFPEEQVEEDPSKAKEREFVGGMKAVKQGTNMLPEAVVVGEREQPKEEKKQKEWTGLIEGDPKSKVRVRGREMTLEQMNQLRIDDWNKNNPDDKKEDILPMEKRIDFKGVIELPLSPDRLLQKYMRGQLNEAYENDPDIKRQVDMAMREYEKRGGKFRDMMTRSDLFTTGVGTRPEIYQPGYGYSEEELSELIPRYAALAEERGMVLPKGFERFLTEE